MPNDAPPLPYRPCVGIVLLNQQGLIFAGERVDTPGAWQMPQGGIDEGEETLAAAHRELEEETGVSADKVSFIGEHPDWLTYDLPDHLAGKAWGGKYRGQKQRWFYFRFTGQDTDISIDHDTIEFSRWSWKTSEALLASIVAFKRDIYTAVLANKLVR